MSRALWYLISHLFFERYRECSLSTPPLRVGVRGCYSFLHEPSPPPLPLLHHPLLNLTPDSCSLPRPSHAHYLFPVPTDLIITVPEALAKQVMTSDLTVVPLPKELQIPSFTVSQIWHERFTKDAAHQWLRRLVKSASADLHRSSVRRSAGK